MNPKTAELLTLIAVDKITIIKYYDLFCNKYITFYVVESYMRIQSSEWETVSVEKLLFYLELYSCGYYVTIGTVLCIHIAAKP